MSSISADKVACEYRRLLEGNDPGAGHLPSFFVPTPVHLHSLCVPNPGEFAHFLKNGGGGGWALLELTDALSLTCN